MVTDPQTHKHTHRQDRLQYTAPLSLAHSVINKAINKSRNIIFLSPICPKVPLKWTVTKLGVLGRPVDLINNCAIFFGNQCKGFDFVGVKFHLFPLSWGAAINTVQATALPAIIYYLIMFVMPNPEEICCNLSVFHLTLNLSLHYHEKHIRIQVGNNSKLP